MFEFNEKQIIDKITTPFKLAIADRSRGGNSTVQVFGVEFTSRLHAAKELRARLSSSEIKEIFGESLALILHGEELDEEKRNRLAEAIILACLCEALASGFSLSGVGTIGIIVDESWNVDLGFSFEAIIPATSERLH